MARAREVESEQPIVAYYCSYYSLTKAINLRDNSDERANRFVTGLLEKCETMKKQIPPDNGTHRGIVEEFALRVFDHADDEDRADQATKATARSFYAAMCFLEVCTVFAPLTEDLTERLNYARWKAADITKALREGRRPIPGAPGEAEARAKEEAQRQSEQAEAAPPESNATVPPAPPEYEYEHALAREEDRYPPAPKYPSSDAPSPLKPAAPPAVPLYPTLDIEAPPRSAAPEPPSLDLPAHPAPPALHLPIEPQIRGGFDAEALKSVNAKVKPYEAPVVQEPAVAADSPPATVPSVSPVEPVAPVEPIQPVEPVQPVQHIVPVQPAQPVAPVQQSTVVQQTGARTRAVSNYKPSIREAQDAQRLAKYAASALDFQDIKTAISNLEQALQLLQGKGR